MMLVKEVKALIEIKNLTKTFDKVVAIDKLSLNIERGTVVGLVGSNGGGKSTLLRTLSGIYNADSGEITIEGASLYNNPSAKGKCFFIPDFPFFYNNSTINSTAALYRDLYPNWSEERFIQLCSMFPVSTNANIINMSKGMQRQAALILALSTCPQYLFLDEIFDGLDPVVRLLLKKLLIEQVSEKQMTIVIASHNLRELEDLCDRVCLMHRGKMTVDRDIYSLRDEFRKVQVAFTQLPAVQNIFEGINTVNVWQNGNIFNVTIRGTEEEFMPKLNALNPAYISAMPLTLEEIFISEMGASGYDTNNII